MPASLKVLTASTWLAAALLMAAGSALGQVFPSRTITLVCPWPPGGSTDTHLRQFADVSLAVLVGVDPDLQGFEVGVGGRQRRDLCRA